MIPRTPSEKAPRPRLIGATVHRARRALRRSGVRRRLAATRTLARSCLHLLLCGLGLAGCDKDEDKPPPYNPLVEKFIAGTYGPGPYAYPLPYRLYIPEGYDKSQKYPLVLYLHGAGSWGNDNVLQLDENARRLVSDKVQAIQKSFVLAPQCPKGDQWVNGDDSAPFTNYVQANVPESDASKLNFELLEKLEREYAIDDKRIYVTGPSMGGSGSWDYITRHPGIFAAAVPVTGVNDPSRADVIKDLPIWAFHGVEDPVAPVDNTRTMIARLKALGSPAKFTALEGVGHDSWQAAYDDMDMFRWLFAQKRE